MYMYKATAIIAEMLKKEDIAFVTYQKTDKRVLIDETESTKAVEITEEIEVIETAIIVDGVPDIVFNYLIYNNRNQIEIETGDIMHVPEDCICHVLESLNRVNSELKKVYELYLSTSNAIRMRYSFFYYPSDMTVRDMTMKSYLRCKKEIEENLEVLNKALVQTDLQHKGGINDVQI